MKNYIYSFILLLVLGTNAFAALSAVVSVTNSPVKINQKVNVLVTISNTSASALTLNSLYITATANGKGGTKPPAAFSVFNTGPNAPSLTLAANLVTVVPMQANFFYPSTGITGAGTGQYYIGATFTTTDGSITSAATAGQVTVNPLPLPASERQ